MNTEYFSVRDEQSVDCIAVNLKKYFSMDRKAGPSVDSQCIFCDDPHIHTSLQDIGDILLLAYTILLELKGNSGLLQLSECT